MWVSILQILTAYWNFKSFCLHFWEVNSWWLTSEDRPYIQCIAEKDLDFKIYVFWDFLGGPMVKNLPCNIGDAVSAPRGRTKIPYASEKVSPRAPTRDSVNCKEDPAFCN